jgi:hypothetical protein
VYSLDASGSSNGKFYALRSIVATLTFHVTCTELGKPVFSPLVLGKAGKSQEELMRMRVEECRESECSAVIAEIGMYILTRKSAHFCLVLNHERV